MKYLFAASDKFRYLVNSTTYAIEVKDLKHFSHYSIYVQACRERVPTEMPPFAPQHCSSERMENIQTLPLGECTNVKDSECWMIEADVIFLFFIFRKRG